MTNSSKKHVQANSCNTQIIRARTVFVESDFLLSLSLENVKNKII